MRKGVIVQFIVILSLGSLLLLQPSLAQALTLPTLTAPVFTAKYVPSSYSESSVDPYTGQTIIQQRENKTIEVIIQNQKPLFTPYFEASTNATTALFYYVQIKGHFEEWTEIHNPWCQAIQSDSDYTTVQMTAEYYPAVGQIDLRVRALIGGDLLPPDELVPVCFYYPLYFVNQTSDWSNPQTLTLGVDTPGAPTTTATDNTPSPFTPQETPQSAQTQAGSQTLNILGSEWAKIAVLPIIAVIAAVVIIAIIYRREKSPQ